MFICRRKALIKSIITQLGQGRNSGKNAEKKLSYKKWRDRE